ncbi:uncharacterized protein SPSK_07693 [Sporothrix schenckii 1099-18]|nr:uncharacterized protein SPSK_07693 [Sporothrix schenckii 1099-18]KJR88621.1 hypothetical protein SPSK_07693 [Sporothrix schenckii 1099-18]
MPARLPSRWTHSLGWCLSESNASSPCRASSFVSSPPPTALRLRLAQPVAGFHTSTSAHATAGAAGAPMGIKLTLPADYVPPTQPPSAKKPDIRKSQLLRSYTSLLRSTPLILMFQHNNLTGAEWSALRRELSLALRIVATQQKQLGVEWPDSLADNIRLNVIGTRIFSVAMRIAEFYDPSTVTAETTAAVVRGRGKKGAIYNHDLSDAAYASIKAAEQDGRTGPESSVYGQLKPLLVGPMALLTFPDVSPAHLAAALSVLSPSPPQFPAPTRKKSPGYYDPLVQSAVQKLLLVGGHIENQAFDTDGVRWVGSIEGGRAGLQAQLVSLLQSAGLGLTSALEGASKSLWLTMESRKTQLEDGTKDDKET